MKVTQIGLSNCLLGEGPVWMETRQELVFVDIIGRRLLTWHRRNGLKDIRLDMMVGSFCKLPDGRFLAAANRGLFILDRDTGSLSSIGNDRLIGAENLMNDGKCDRSGRFVFGSKALNERAGSGKMMVFDGMKIHSWQAGIVMNGPAFDPDGTRIYFADSPTKNIFAAPYDPETGIAGPARTFATLQPDAGYPDGMTVDSEGGLWNAHWDGWRISRYLPDGTLDLEIPMPVAKPTSMAFGGADMRTLFVTSAKIGKAGDPVPEGGQNGNLFAIETDFTGIPEPVFSGTL